MSQNEVSVSAQSLGVCDIFIGTCEIVEWITIDRCIILLYCTGIIKCVNIETWSDFFPCRRQFRKEENANKHDWLQNIPSNGEI